MASTSEIRRRIGSVRQTQKITHAMYLISQAKLRKAKQELDNTRPYFQALQNEVGRVFNTDSTEGVIEFDNLRLDMNSYELRVKGKVVEAPPKELELLNCLASHPNRVYTRDQLLDEVWGFEYYGDSRTIDVHVKRLREKLAGASDKWELKTVWGVGYKFEVRQ